MGMSVGDNKGGAMAEMNVVPLIDILLVLLIIFMVITPLTPKGMDTLVPQPNPNQQQNQDLENKTVVVQVLKGTRVWTSIFQAWRDGASLAGSSAGAMALCSHTLIRAGWPDRTQRRPVLPKDAEPKVAGITPQARP